MAEGIAIDVHELIGLARSAQAVSGAIGETRRDGLLGRELAADAFGDTEAARALWQAHRQVVGSGDDAVNEVAALIGDTSEALYLAADAYQRGDETIALTFLGISAVAC